MHKLSKRSKSRWRSKLARHPRVARALKKLSKCYNTYEPYVYLVIAIVVQIAARMQIASFAPLLFRDTSALANLPPSVREYLGMSGIPGKQLTADDVIAAVFKLIRLPLRTRLVFKMIA
ncbi:hypothetical protein GQ42DRAFT_153931 [Ramicandelaber brevisporus]|nr:hypothetical protein GQ42DRAFT_153931 [Ramicandelaber brevisporus]